jgi:hypothetical protein
VFRDIQVTVVLSSDILEMTVLLHLAPLRFPENSAGVKLLFCIEETQRQTSVGRNQEINLNLS